ncbi:uncharacterized protein LOC141630192 [Silene latifolia]|uniref:uncharacterized protein LOC141630192 n=1 Tax=Silene latifolia TaxID=37657 RepID=UPI003D76BC46
MGKQEAENDAYVVTGTFLVHNTPSFILFDSGETHSLVSSGHALAMGLGEYQLVEDSVFIPSGELVSCSKLYRDVSMFVGEVDLPINLSEFPMDRFEVIVVMDWSGFDGNDLKDDITFHPVTDSQTEKTIKTLEDMLRAYALEFGGVGKIGWT